MERKSVLLQHPTEYFDGLGCINNYFFQILIFNDSSEHPEVIFQMCCTCLDRKKLGILILILRERERERYPTLK